MSEPDPIFSDPRLARAYDPLDPDRSDLDAYVGIVAEFGAESVLDVGCGTGTLALMLAARGVTVVGVDPAGASLDVARAKPGADAVTWLHGDATSLPPLQVDLVTMTANVAQVFLTDADLAVTLAGIRAALRPGGLLVFETRDPARRAWESWTPANSLRELDLEGVGHVRTWDEVIDVSDDLVTFRWTFVIDDETVTSTSTLRFLAREGWESALAAAGFSVQEVRDAPDRPGRELVFLAVRD